MTHAPAVDLTVGLATYKVTIGADTLDRLGGIARSTVGADRYAIVTDTVVGPLYAQRVKSALSPARVDVFTIPAGESFKTRETWARVTDQLLAERVGRDGAVVALGGGVVGDLAGFVAATYMRGIPVIQLPTTLLAMIDASVGGKTAVDAPAGKNLVGAFHPPAAVIADTSTLASLPAVQLRSGIAEALKHGIVADPDHLDQAIACLPALFGGRRDATGAVPRLVARSVEIKAAIVTSDERELGVRKVLNFGHTIGHALEHVTGYAMPHGECVAVGMAIECEIAERLGVADRGTADRVRAALVAAGLPSALPPHAQPEAVLAATRHDKKARSGVVEYALPARIGAMAGEATAWGIRVPDAVVLDVLHG